jgi:chromosome segregation and condensation protein ScpB
MSDLPARLALLAAQGKTLTYGALAADLGCRIADLTAALERLMEDDARAGRPLRAALLEGRLTNGLPARGFFDKAAELGIDVTDPAAFVAATRAQLFLKNS